MHKALVFLGTYFLFAGIIKLIIAMILRWKENHNGN